MRKIGRAGFGSPFQKGKQNDYRDRLIVIYSRSLERQKIAVYKCEQKRKLLSEKITGINDIPPGTDERTAFNDWVRNVWSKKHPDCVPKITNIEPGVDFSDKKD